VVDEEVSVVLDLVEVQPQVEEVVLEALV